MSAECAAGVPAAESCSWCSWRRGRATCFNYTTMEDTKDIKVEMQEVHSASPAITEDVNLINSTEDIKKETTSDNGVKDGESSDETAQIVAQIMERMKSVQIIMAPQKDVRILDAADAQLKATSDSPTSEENAHTDEMQGQTSPEKDDVQTEEASGSETKTQPKWSPGSRCRAVFSDDGMAYPAVVIWVKGDRCRIRYEKYDNEEELTVSCLLSPNELHGPRRTYPVPQVGDRPTRLRYKADAHPGDSRSFQRKPVANPVTPQPITTAQDSVSYNAHPVCPPTLSAMEDGGGNDPDSAMASLSGLLQAWYMCGYRTGRYMISVTCNCPPLPPPLLAMEHSKDIDIVAVTTLSTTLQAWYMCGYRTGRYMTLLQRE